MEAIRAPRGAALRCRGWKQEAALRMLMNSLDADVAERPRDLIVYGAEKVARDWPCYHAIVRELEALANDETLLVQSGKAVGVFRTHEEAPRVLIVSGNLVGHRPAQDQSRTLERLGFIMQGEMTAGSWTYTGLQGIVQGTYEIFAAAARKHFGGSLEGRFVVSGGMGGMGGAQPLAAAMNGAAFLGIEVDPERIKRRLRSGHCDIMVTSLNEAVRILRSAVHQKRAISVGLVGNCAELLPEMARRGIVPDLLTDQTSAHDPLYGYIPAGLSIKQAGELRAADPDEYRRRSTDSIAVHVRAMLELKRMGSVVFNFGNNIRYIAADGGVEDAVTIPGLAREYLRPMLMEGRGPCRWVALSGEPADITATDTLVCRLFPANEALTKWISLAKKKVRFQGLPARTGWLGYGERARFALEVNRMVASGELKAPIAIGSDHVDCASVASPDCETEGMPDGRLAVADWPILNALLDVAAGASWVSMNNGGGIGYSLHAAQVTVAEGTEQSARCLERVMSCDPGFGVLRLLDAGYEEAARFAASAGLRAPMNKGPFEQS